MSQGLFVKDSWALNGGMSGGEEEPTSRCGGADEQKGQKARRPEGQKAEGQMGRLAEGKGSGGYLGA